jgi:hypothetical protein
MLSLITVIYCWLFIFFISFCTASVTKEIHESKKYLFELQLLVKDENTKLKVKNVDHHVVHHDIDFICLPLSYLYHTNV